MSELTAIVNPTQQQVIQAQQRAVQEAQGLANSITGVDGPNQALVREILPDVDLSSGGDNTWNGTDREFVQSGLTADQENTVYNIDSNNEAQDKVVVIYGLANVAADPITTEVVFNDGTGATFARFNTEQLEIAEISDYMLFDEVIVYGSTEDGDLIQWPNDAGDDKLVYLAKVAEPLGNTLSTREGAEARLARR